VDEIVGEQIHKDARDKAPPTGDAA